MSNTINAFYLRAFRALEVPYIVCVPLFFPAAPTFVVAFGLIYFLALNGLYYEPSRRLVVRMDLLPDSETLFIQKMGFGGVIHGQTIGLDDLQKLNLADFETNGTLCDCF